MNRREEVVVYVVRVYCVVCVVYHCEPAVLVVVVVIPSTCMPYII